MAGLCEGGNEPPGSLKASNIIELQSWKEIANDVSESQSLIQRTVIETRYIQKNLVRPCDQNAPRKNTTKYPKLHTKSKEKHRQTEEALEGPAESRRRNRPNGLIRRAFDDDG
ncbi:hypothetical protein ANN_04083 [Periplaneta americana]|uniref:Uncharacterized protein n=1 Tax=Periplaneta americana TaxID=6978 RepID=A0ABQ8T7L5_PERAM|nr:hypothetical protein ANN_04083 [Periplaneta americana]